MLDKLARSRPQTWCFAALFVLLLATRLCHLHILWAEEGYGAAGGLQILQGKALYKDIWFDKPPLAAWLYLAWGAFAGWPLRLAGAVLAWLTCLAAYRAGAKLWSPREGSWAAGFAGFFLVFDTPAAVMTWAPDLLSVPLSLAAVSSAASGSAWWAGFWCALALHANAKALLLLGLVLAAAGRKSPRVLASFAIWFGAGLVGMALHGSLGDYWLQVWEAGRLYARDTFLADPVSEGALRSAHWLGFHLALLFPAVAGWKALREPRLKLLFLAWLTVGAANVVAGERFFPRYYLALLPPLVLLAAKGMAALSAQTGWPRPPWRKAVIWATLLAALVPAVRFGPRYFLLAAGEWSGRPTGWLDVAMNRDSQQVSSEILARLHSGEGPALSNRTGPETPAPSGAGDLRKPDLLVWGYRPDLFVYTRLPAATRFLDSQMLTGVLADRHLTRTHVSILGAAANRAALTASHPTVVVDGLGPLNPALGMDRYPEIEAWLRDGYRVAFRTRYSTVYVRR